ncbi:hypothetical protein GYN24_05720 [Lactococcus piscium]|uniref:FtsK domain-containing protein n=1 Tax=Pseudolactococcus paracarnosus TaxID=2749962 RepID=A0A7L4WBY5_9LACT|nr:hypothetical protein [Lactococcus paracarnosus]MCJ1994076.1 hypothetical protein [Lactococcus paracarnosus]QDJ27414.1 hypothetical protein BHS01_02000 [Lactococcus paracarnosus]SPC36751.1 conserved hypothetical protein [Lactococcus piscium]
MTFKLSDELDIDEFHVYLTGASGVGKTALTYLRILTSARDIFIIQNDGYKNLRVIDPKGGSLFSLRHSVPNNGSKTFANSPESALALLNDFYEEITKRGKLLDNASLRLDADYHTLGLPPCWLFFDEYIDLIEQARIIDKKIANEITSLLVRCITKGRQLGCFLWITAMRADTAYLPGLIRSTMINIALATKGREIDPDNARMMFGTTDLEKPSPHTKYYGYVKGESGKPTLFLTPRLADNVDIRKILAHYMKGEYL